jgi:hypothetical protein
MSKLGHGKRGAKRRLAAIQRKFRACRHRHEESGAVITWPRPLYTGTTAVRSSVVRELIETMCRLSIRGKLGAASIRVRIAEEFPNATRAEIDMSACWAARQIHQHRRNPTPDAWRAPDARKTEVAARTVPVNVANISPKES